MSLLRPQTLKEAIELFAEDDDGKLYLGYTFGALKTSLVVNAKPSDKQHKFHWNAYRHLIATSQDIWNISALVERLEWMRALAIKIANNQSKESWRIYAKLDMSHIFLSFGQFLTMSLKLLPNSAKSLAQCPILSKN